MVKVIYSLFLGLLISIFIGVGVSVFYNEPEHPDEPDFYSYEFMMEGEEQSEEQRAKEIAFQNKVEIYDEEMAEYNRNVSLVLIALAIALLGIGLGTASKIEVISDGVLYGGIFTLFYGMTRGLASDSDTARFLVISICLVVVIVLGYFKFVKPNQEKSSKKKEDA